MVRNLVSHIEDEERSRVTKNRVHREMTGLKPEGMTGGWRNFHNRSFTVCPPHYILLE
jgi:hypothetical protein